jgi:hypothetical protein
MTPLTSLEVWKTEGISKYNFCAVQTYTNSGDKFISYYKRLEDKKGNNYYVSIPPFNFIFAHIFLSSFDLPVKISSIRLLNIILLIGGSIFIYLSICTLFGIKKTSFYAPAFAAMASYLFMPINVFDASMAFFCEFFLWTICIYLFSEIIFGKTFNKTILFLFGVFIFLINYTEWCGLFLSLSVLGFTYIHRGRIPKAKQLLVITAIFTALSLLLTLIQYSSLAGFPEMAHAMKIRYLERSGMFGKKLSDQGVYIFSLDSLKIFFKNLNYALRGFGYALIILIIIIPFSRSHKIKIFFEKQFLIYVSVIPVLLHFLFFFNSNAVHSSAMVRIAVPVSLFIGYYFNIIFSTAKSLKIPAIIIMSLALISSFWILNVHYTSPASNKKEDLNIQRMANIIKSEEKPDEAVFISNNKRQSPAFLVYFLTYYSKRNVQNIDDTIEAKNICMKFKKQNAVFFDFDSLKTAVIPIHLRIN